MLSRHADVQAANRDSELFVAFDGPQLSHQPEIQGTMLVSMDGRDHSRLRRLVSAGFTPRMIRRLDEQARRWAVAIVDHAVEQGECDFVEQIAYPLPMNMIADILGIPIEDREHVFAVTAEFLNGGDPERGVTQRERVGAQLEDVRVRPAARARRSAPNRRTTCGRSCRRSRSKATTARAPR